jgi:ParB-like nuclease domain
LSSTQKNREKPRKIARAGAELGLVSILHRNLASIRPSPVNDKLYRPVSPNDPEIAALAESIRQHGLREPLVITLDGFILSGHRRYLACRLAGLTEVPCRVENMRSTDSEFLTMLTEFNRQRVKSVDEMAREAIISANPDEAHRVLLEHRKQQSRVDAETITIVGTKHRAKITSAKQPMLDAILAILEDRKAFWPLTDRQIHYALLNDPPLVHAKKPQSTYRNTVPCYKATCELLTRARLAGLIPFRAIEDPTRPMHAWNFHRSPQPYLQKEFDQFLKGYYRDLQQSQPNHIEIVGEKNTIDSIIRPVALEYCIPLTIGRGYCSLPPRHAMTHRFRKSGKEKLILLALGDFDPEGEDIAHSFARSLRDDFGVANIKAVKVALTASQVRELELPPVMKAKETSSRHDGFVERHGDDVFELEAVPPDQLQEILRDAIDSVLDLKAYNAEIDREKSDAAKLDGIRRTLRENLGSIVTDSEDAEE